MSFCLISPPVWKRAANLVYHLLFLCLLGWSVHLFPLVFGAGFTSWWPPVWETAVHLAVAGDIFYGIFYAVLFHAGCLGWDLGLN